MIYLSTSQQSIDSKGPCESNKKIQLNYIIVSMSGSRPSWIATALA